MLRPQTIIYKPTEQQKSDISGMENEHIGNLLKDNGTDATIAIQLNDEGANWIKLTNVTRGDSQGQYQVL